MDVNILAVVLLLFTSPVRHSHLAGFQFQTKHIGYTTKKTNTMVWTYTADNT